MHPADPGRRGARARAPRGTACGLLAVLATLAVAAPPASCLPATAPADSGAVALHLEDAVALAMQRNWDVRSAVQDLAIARAQVRAALARPNPAVSALAGRVHVDGRGDRTPLGNDLWSRGYDTVVQLGQPIELGGKRRTRGGLATAGADAARAQLGDVRRTVEQDAVQAYVAAALLGANARIALESAGYLRDEARIAEVRWNAGDISRSDLDRIQIASSQLDLDARAAEAAALEQRVALEVLLGLPRPHGATEVADSLETLADREVDRAPAALSGVRPDLAAARAQLRRAELALRLERAQRIPDPTLVLQFEHQPPDRPNTLGLGVSFPLPLWDRNAGAISAALAARESAALAVARAEARVSADVAATSAALEEASARWRRYRDDLRPRSEGIRRTVSLAYEKGAASLVDLLEAQRNDNDVRLATMQAASDVMMAAAALRSATTTIPPGDTRP